MTANPIHVQKFLSGIDYPTSKQALVDHARSQGADDEVISTLEQLPSEDFDSPNDVSDAIGRLF